VIIYSQPAVTEEGISEGGRHGTLPLPLPHPCFSENETVLGGWGMGGNSERRKEEERTKNG